MLNPRLRVFAFAMWMSALVPAASGAQGLTGALFGTVKDQQGAVVPGAFARLSSSALIGGPATSTTNEKGQLRFVTLPPGTYALDIELAGFATYHEEDIPIGAGATIERTAILNVAGVADSIVVQGAGSRIDARDPGFGTRFGPEDLGAIPTRRSSMFDFLRATPGVSPTSPSSGTVTTVSSFGSGTNENQFLIDGTNMTCPCNGIARAELGVDFIREIQVQSVGASAEFGNMQGAVVNVITRQGSERFLYDGSYYTQTAALTSQPVVLSLAKPATGQSGYERARYRDFTSNLGGPVVRDRLWFFTGYQYLRDYDSQPGTDPRLPRKYEQNKIFTKLTWRLAPAWQLDQTLHDEFWVRPEQPTLAKPFDATLRSHATVPAITFGHLTHTLSSNTFWDVRAGRFVYTQIDDPSTGNRTAASHFDNATGILSGAPQTFGALTLARTTVKATLSHYRLALLGADHEWKIGTQVERGEHNPRTIVPTGVRYLDNAGQPSQAVSIGPSNVGGLFNSLAAFATDAITVGNRLTLSAGVRFDRNRAISQDLRAVDLEGHETGAIVRGLGTLYTWNVFSPRLGATAKLTADGRTLLRASYGRFHQGVLTGEFQGFHPGATPTTTADFDPATGAYTSKITVVDPRLNLRLDSGMRPPYTDEYGIGVDRDLGGRLSAAIAYIHKQGANFIGWTDVGGVYSPRTYLLPNGAALPVFDLVNARADRRFLLTNPDGYSMRYNGLVAAVERRRSHGWQAFGSYTLSRATGLQASSGTGASAAQASTVAPFVVYGRDPNDLTNARGRLANDRPHMFRAMGAVDLFRTGIALSANLQCFSGKPWAATALVPVAQNPQQRILLEPRGARRLPSQSLLDLRASRAIRLRGVGRVELILDVLNALNDAAEEDIVTDNLFSPQTFGQGKVFMDPRRAMISAKVNLGR